ncbi:MAG: prenyltransferase/squalene oxidase repeat-containing protein, partial [Planctomycetota bacterium]
LMPGPDSLPMPEIDTELELDRQIESEFQLPAAMPLTSEEFPGVETELTDVNQFSMTSEIDTFEQTAEAHEVEIDRRHDDSAPAPPDIFENVDIDIPRPDIFTSESNVDEEFPVLADRPEIAAPFTSDLLNDDAMLPSSIETLPSIAAQPLRQPSPTVASMMPATQLKVMSPTHRAGDGEPMPEMYALRNAANRMASVQQRGGSIETERAVNDALEWLQSSQEADGSWNPRRWGGGQEPRVYGHDRQGAGSSADTGITALATLAFMAAGHNHLEDGPYRETVQKGLEYLIRKQTTDGNLAGEALLFARMYCHSMSLLALSEGLALTGDQRLLPAVQIGVDYLVRAQNTFDGGWRYQPGDRGDMSQFGWQVLALRSAATGGAYVPEETTGRMKLFLEKCTSGPGNGLGSYRPDQQVSTTMTAEALVCRFFLVEEVDELTRETAMSRVLNEVPSADHVNLYYWYYGTMAAYQSGGSSWDRWNQALKRALLTTQEREGSNMGSWAPVGVWAPYGGRVYSTAMAALCLEVYYRYLPVYETNDPGEATASSPEDIEWR